jgi:CheY-like chemotaxis protein
MRSALATLLRQRGYAVCMPVMAPYSSGALKLLESEKVDVVILDLILGPEGLDGFDLARRMRDDPRWRSIPVIISSGLDDHEIKERAMQYAFLGMRTKSLCKPIDTSVLFRTLEEIENEPRESES